MRPREFACGLAAGLLLATAVDGLVPPGAEPWLTVGAVAVLSWAVLTAGPKTR